MSTFGTVKVSRGPTPNRGGRQAVGYAGVLGKQRFTRPDGNCLKRETDPRHRRGANPRKAFPRMQDAEPAAEATKRTPRSRPPARNDKLRQAEQVAFGINRGFGLS